MSRDFITRGRKKDYGGTLSQHHQLSAFSPPPSLDTIDVNASRKSCRRKIQGMIPGIEPALHQCDNFFAYEIENLKLGLRNNIVPPFGLSVKFSFPKFIKINGAPSGDSGMNFGLSFRDNFPWSFMTF